MNNNLTKCSIITATFSPNEISITNGEIEELTIHNAIPLIITESIISKLVYMGIIFNINSKISGMFTYSSNIISISDCNVIDSLEITSKTEVMLTNTSVKSIIYNNILFTIKFDLKETTSVRFNENEVKLSFGNEYMNMMIPQTVQLKTVSNDVKIDVIRYSSTHLIYYSIHSIVVTYNGNFLFITNLQPAKSFDNCTCLFYLIQFSIY